MFGKVGLDRMMSCEDTRLGEALKKKSSYIWANLIK